MLTLLYPLGFLVSLSGLILWFYYSDEPEKSQLMSKAFLGGFFVYLFSLAFADGELSYKLLILFRDLIVLGVVSQFFSFFRKYKVLFFLLLALLYGSFFFKGFSVMAETFPQETSSQSVPVSTNEMLLSENGELLVELKETHKITELKDILQRFSLNASRAFSPKNEEITDLDDYYVVDIPQDRLDEMAAIVEAFEQSGLIDSWEENEQILLDPLETTPVKATKKDPKQVYKINDPALDKLWGFEKMKVSSLYPLLAKSAVKPQKKANIFILDTGVDAKHEDLKDNYQSLKSKYDNDPAGHGTHCAGIAAAVSNNGKGIASLSQNNEFVQVTSIKVLASFGGGTQKMIIAGMLQAADNGADVISMSLGGPSNRQRQQAYEKAVKYCNKAGAIVVVAAGNSNMNAKDYAPANTPGVITVSAVDTLLHRAHFSNTVQDLKMGLAAPGVKIYSTIPGNKYTFFNGTSMATPYVAGLLGLMKSIQPSLTTQEAYLLLNNNGIETANPQETGTFIQPAKVIEALLQKQ